MPNDPSSQESSKPKRMQYSLKRMLSNEAKNNNMYNVYFKSMPSTQNAGNLKCNFSSPCSLNLFIFLYLAIFTHLNNKYKLQLSTILISNVHRLCRDFATPCALRKISSYPAFFLLILNFLFHTLLWIIVILDVMGISLTDFISLIR